MTPEAARSDTGWLRADDLIVTPDPSAEELAAIVAACELLWPEDTAVTKPTASPRWRYAGRPWTRRPRYGGWR